MNTSYWHQCCALLLIVLLLLLSESVAWAPISFKLSHRPQYSRAQIVMYDPKVNQFNPFQTQVPSIQSSIQAASQEADVERSIKQDFVRSLAWMGAATGFAALLGTLRGPAASIEFASGYILELCLSVDNLFVFLVLFEYFKVSGKAQEKVLNFGIFGAMILRGLFILAGSAAIDQFHQVLFLFAGVLAYSSLNILFGKDKNEKEVSSSISKSPKKDHHMDYMMWKGFLYEPAAQAVPSALPHLS
jgi:hypothetical protein